MEGGGVQGLSGKLECNFLTCSQVAWYVFPDCQFINTLDAEFKRRQFIGRGQKKLRLGLWEAMKIFNRRKIYFEGCHQYKIQQFLMEKIVTFIYSCFSKCKSNALSKSKVLKPKMRNLLLSICFFVYNKASSLVW